MSGQSSEIADDERECPRCAERIKKKALVCRFCNHDFSQKQTKANKPNSKFSIKRVIIALTVLALCWAAYIGVNAVRVVYSVLTESQDEHSKLQVVSSMQAGSNWFGTVVNKGSKTYRSVTISANGYASDGSLVENATDSCRDLEPGRKWNFNLVFRSPSQIKSSKITELTGY